MFLIGILWPVVDSNIPLDAFFHVSADNTAQRIHTFMNLIPCVNFYFAIMSLSLTEVAISTPILLYFVNDCIHSYCVSATGLWGQMTDQYQNGHIQTANTSCYTEACKGHD